MIGDQTGRHRMMKIVHPKLMCGLSWSQCTTPHVRCSVGPQITQWHHWQRCHHFPRTIQSFLYLFSYTDTDHSDFWTFEFSLLLVDREWKQTCWFELLLQQLYRVAACPRRRMRSWLNVGRFDCTLLLYFRRSRALRKVWRLWLSGEAMIWKCFVQR